jgi:putative Holliday junction resolvase
VRILAIDPGEKNIGMAISDTTGTIANPLSVIRHASRTLDAAVIAHAAAEHDAALIVVGQALDDEGESTPSSRRATRLAGAIRSQTDIPVVTWDESNSTQIARAALLAMGVKKHKRKGHADDLAAVIILQSYLDENHHAH